jgi:hypothetical protein
MASPVVDRKLIRNFTILCPSIINLKLLGISEEEIKTILSKLVDVCFYFIFICILKFIRK